MIKRSSIFSVLARKFPFLVASFGRRARPVGRVVARGTEQAIAAAAREAALRGAASHSVAVERRLDYVLPKILEEVGLGHLKGKTGKTVRQGLRIASPEAREAVSKAMKADLSLVSEELARVSALRKAAPDPETLQAIQGRLGYLMARQQRLAERAPYFKQTGWDRFLRGGSLAMEAGFGGLEAYEAYKNMREGNYANAAYHAAMAPIFGLGRIAGVAGRGIKGIKGLKGLGRGIEALGKPFEAMEIAGKYGTSGNKVTRWMMRHPILASEAIATPLGADTMLNGFLRPPKDEPGIGGALPAQTADGGWDYHGVHISPSEARRLQSMPDDQLVDWLKENIVR